MALRLLLLPLLVICLSACPPQPGSMDGLDIQIVPTAPTTDDTLTAAFVAHTFAFDEEGFYYEYAWTVDGADVPDEFGGEVAPEQTLAGEVWAITVTPFQEWEGELRTGPASTDSVVIGEEELLR